MEKEVGGAFLRQVLTDKDEAFVIDFNVESELVQDYTRDVHRLQAALNKSKNPKRCRQWRSGIPGLGQGPVPLTTRPARCFMTRFIFPPMTCWPRKWDARP